MKFRHIFLINSILTVIVVGNAFLLKKQFYPSIVYITKSRSSIFIIGFQAILFLSLLAKVLTKIFFNELMPMEIESLHENIWPILMETCLAFAIFQSSANHVFLFRLLCLYFFKCFHILAKTRMNSMGLMIQMPEHYRLRMIGVLVYLIFIDIFQIFMSMSELTKSGLSIEVMFLFEYLILLLIAINISGNYLLNCIEMQDENPWDEKIVYSNYLELFTISFKLVFNMMLIVLLSKMRHLPIYMFRSFIQDIRKFKITVRRVVMSRRAIARMDRFPHPTQEDLIRDNLCAVCRDDIKDIQSAKKLVCRHVFHITCLKDWFRRQQTCPTCRSNVLNVVEIVEQNQNIQNEGQENVGNQEEEQTENTDQNNQNNQNNANDSGNKSNDENQSLENQN